MQQARIRGPRHTAANACWCFVDQNPQTNREVRAFRKTRDFLLHTVFFESEVLLAQIEDEAAGGVRDIHDNLLDVLLSRLHGSLLKQRDKAGKYGQGFHDRPFYQFKTERVSLVGCSRFSLFNQPGDCLHISAVGAEPLRDAKFGEGVVEMIT